MVGHGATREISPHLDSVRCCRSHLFACHSLGQQGRACRRHLQPSAMAPVARQGPAPRFCATSCGRPPASRKRARPQASNNDGVPPVGHRRQALAAMAWAVGGAVLSGRRWVWGPDVAVAFVAAGTGGVGHRTVMLGAQGTRQPAQRRCTKVR